MKSVERINKMMSDRGVSAYEIAKNTGISESTLSRILSGKTKKPNARTIASIENYLASNYGSNASTELKVNESREIFNTKSGNTIEELSNGKFLLTVPLVPYKAHATYISEFADAEYIQDLTKVSFIVDRIPRGKYQAFEIINDSMNDATLERSASREAILSGDIVLGRELGKQHWTSKLNTNGYPFWIIVTHHNIICKEIINHNVEKGIITCHSLNSSPEFQDFDLRLDECHQLFNIIKKQV